MALALLRGEAALPRVVRRVAALEAVLAAAVAAGVVVVGLFAHGRGGCLGCLVGEVWMVKDDGVCWGQAAMR